MVLVVVMSKSFMTITSKLVMMNCCGCEPLKNHSFGRFSFCATPVNETSLMVLGGWGEKGALDSVQVGYHRIVIMFSLSHTVSLQCSLGHLHFVQILDLKSGRWEDGPSLPSPRLSSTHYHPIIQHQHHQPHQRTKVTAKPQGTGTLVSSQRWPAPEASWWLAELLPANRWR